MIMAATVAHTMVDPDSVMEDAQRSAGASQMSTQASAPLHGDVLPPVKCDTPRADVEAGSSKRMAATQKPLAGRRRASVRLAQKIVRTSGACLSR